jgi:hypothetical protein
MRIWRDKNLLRLQDSNILSMRRFAEAKGVTVDAAVERQRFG